MSVQLELDRILPSYDPMTCAQVGRGGLERPTSPLERPERCADELAEIETPERRVGCYQEGF